MAGFTPERRRDNRTANWKGEERRAQAGAEANRDPLAGPLGTALGAAVGAVVGGLAGKGIAELIDPTAEEAYWRENYDTQPHYEKGYAYEDYHPAYRTGWEGRGRYEGRSFDEVEGDLEADYNRNRGNSRLAWDKNRHAARAAWDRFDVTDDFERSQ